MYNFAGLIRQTLPPTFSDTAITDHYFPAQIILGANILVYWIGKVVRTCAAGGSRTLDFRRKPCKNTVINNKKSYVIEDNTNSYTYYSIFVRLYESGSFVTVSFYQKFRCRSLPKNCILTQKHKLNETFVILFSLYTVGHTNNKWAAAYPNTLAHANRGKVRK